MRRLRPPRQRRSHGGPRCLPHAGRARALFPPRTVPTVPGCPGGRSRPAATHAGSRRRTAPTTASTARAASTPATKRLRGQKLTTPPTRKPASASSPTTSTLELIGGTSSAALRVPSSRLQDALGRRGPLETGVPLGRRAQGAGERLVLGLGDVVRVAAAGDPNVQRDAG